MKVEGKENQGDRRPVQARRSQWAQRATGVLIGWGVSANVVSCGSVFFAAIGFGLFCLAGSSGGGWVEAAALVAHAVNKEGGAA